MYSPPPLWLPNMPVITPAFDVMAPFTAAGATPSSGAWNSASRAILIPVRLPEPMTVLKMFWLNGATVGTDSIDMGIYQMTDPVTGRCDLIRSCGPVLSAGAVNVIQEVGTWKTAHANLLSASSTVDATSFTTASVTLKAGRLYLMAVENSHGTSAAAVSAITGGGTWTSRSTTQFNGTLNRVSIWSCVPTADYTGTILIDFGGGNTETGAIWALEEMSGVDTTTNDGIVQQAVGTGTSVTPLATLAAFGNANNATYGAHGQAAAAAATPGAGFTELTDSNVISPSQALETEWQVGNDTTVDATITSAPWGSCAVEIKASTSPFVIPPVMPGQPDIYMAMVMSGVTATIFRNTSQGFSIQAFRGMLNRAAAYPLPSSMLATSLSSSIDPVAGFSSRSLIG